MFGATDSQPDNAQPDANGVFADVFDEVRLLSYSRDTITTPASYCDQKSRDTHPGGVG